MNEAAEKLKELEFAIDAAELGTWNLDSVTGKIDTNARLKDWFGLSSDADISLSLAAESIDEKDRERVEQAIASAISYNPGSKYDIVYTIIHPVTKVSRIVHAKGKAWFAEDHTCYRFNGTIQNITGIIEADRKSFESEPKYRDLFVSMDQGFCIIELIMDEKFEPVDYVFLELNPVFELQTGLKNAIGRTARELVPGLEKQWFEMYGRVAVTGESIRFIQGSEAMGRWFEVYAYRSGAPQDLHVALLFTDITARKLADIALEKSESNLRTLLLQAEESEANLHERVKQRTEEIAEMNNVLLATNDELGRTNRDLQALNDQLEQYAYIASHDLQEPLRKIRTFSSILEAMKDLPESALGFVQKVTASAERMSSLIKDLLEFSTLAESSNQMKPVDLNDIVQAVAKDFELLLEEKRGVIQFEKLPVIEALPLQMNQLFYNLIGNALKFSADTRNPVVQIRAVPIDARAAAEFISQPANDTDYHLITITDNGIGFDNKYADHIFEVFRRLRGRHQYPGSGIGLSLCKKIAEIHHGHLSASSEPEQGSTFRIILPQHQSALS